MRTAGDFGFTDHTPIDVVAVRRVRTEKQRRRRLIGNILFACVFTVAVVGWFVALRPAQLGGPATFVVVQGVSMEPTYHTGDLVISHRQSSYAVGDVVA